MSRPCSFFLQLVGAVLFMNGYTGDSMSMLGWGAALIVVGGIGYRRSRARREGRSG